ncbi:MAG: nucleoside 2-deoxyribosyltransferase [Deferribacteres bacterium]|nr:nucleoside 2-deoxyribosyltransferase [candidate division KSB1 bacterium]MCB9504319.1 nucleoside 2-deoxyribosyltransferase [Deferribacteres bacterium]
MPPDISQFIKTLKRQKADYIPLVELGVHPDIKARYIGRSIVTLTDEVEFWHKAGYDYVKLQPVADFNPAKVGLEEKITYNDDGTIARKWARHDKGIITNFAELENYQFPKKTDFDYSKFEQVGALLPEGMGVIGQYGDIFTMAWELMGFENFSLALFMEPELIDALMGKIGDLVFSMFDYFAQSDVVDVLWYSDDIAFTEGLLISPDSLRRHFFPWLRKIGELAKAHQKPFIYHTDGVLWDVFDDIIACGVDAIHPIEPKAMKIAEVKQRVGDRLALLGHVDVDLLSRGTPANVRRQVLKNVEEAGYNGGYCIGSGNSVPDYAKFENYLEMLEVAKELRQG